MPERFTNENLRCNFSIHSISSSNHHRLLDIKNNWVYSLTLKKGQKINQANFSELVITEVSVSSIVLYTTIWLDNFNNSGVAIKVIEVTASRI
jgi:hypothetical protein